MSTQFYERQDKARTNTLWLVVLFLIAVIGIVGVMATAGYFLGEYAATRISTQSIGRDNPITGTKLAVIFGVVAAVVILFGSLFQITMLRSHGGTSVAESVGGRLIAWNTSNAAERMVLNVVEEMAIASGTPVPPVFILEEPGINAFAAGYLPSDAVVAVTRGAVETLSREELQGVIAHEFSHILNGDMRMNIRMIGILHGILLLGLIGMYILRAMRYVGNDSSSSNRDNKGQAAIVVIIMAAGVILYVAGAIGTFIGGLIKAAVSRQREYLADASAVQFTRNPGGISGALKQIAAISQHGMLNHPNASVASHMYFSQGVFEGFSGIMATHPPLPQRILALEPNWDGELPTTVVRKGLYVSNPTSSVSSGAQAIGASNFAGNPAFGPKSTASNSPRQLVDAQQLVPVPQVRSAADQVGAPVLWHRQFAATLLSDLDEAVKSAAHETYSARAMVMALLLSDNSDIRTKQFEALATETKPDLVELTRALAPYADRLPEAARLPVVDLALPSLRRMSLPQYREFARAFAVLCKADKQISIFEWTLAQVFVKNLKRNFEKPEATTTLYFRLDGLQGELSLLFSVLAQVGQDKSDQQIAFDQAASRFPAINLQLMNVDINSFRELDAVLAKLARAHPKRRGEIVDACASLICADGIVKVREAELLRGISDLLECPMPPLTGVMERDGSRSE